MESFRTRCCDRVISQRVWLFGLAEELTMTPMRGCQIRVGDDQLFAKQAGGNKENAPGRTVSPGLLESSHLHQQPLTDNGLMPSQALNSMEKILVECGLLNRLPDFVTEGLNLNILINLNDHDWDSFGEAINLSFRDVTKLKKALKNLKLHTICEPSEYYPPGPPPRFEPLEGATEVRNHVITRCLALRVEEVEPSADQEDGISRESQISRQVVEAEQQTTKEVTANEFVKQPSRDVDDNDQLIDGALISPPKLLEERDQPTIICTNQHALTQLSPWGIMSAVELQSELQPPDVQEEEEIMEQSFQRAEEQCASQKMLPLQPLLTSYPVFPFTSRKRHRRRRPISGLTQTVTTIRSEERDFLSSWARNNNRIWSALQLHGLANWPLLLTLDRQELQSVFQTLPLKDGLELKAVLLQHKAAIERSSQSPLLSRFTATDHREEQETEGFALPRNEARQPFEQSNAELTPPTGAEFTPHNGSL